MAHSIPLLDDLLVVIVLFRQSLSESLSYRSLTESFAGSKENVSWFIYDNSPEALDLKSLPSKLIYLHDAANPGVSKAYNEAFKIARQLNKRWLLLADQDTEFPLTIFSDYSNAVERYPAVSVFAPFLYDAKGAISPFRLKWGKGRRIQSSDRALCSLKDLRIMNSGMLISLDTFERAGGYDERFPLDYSDIAFLDKVYKITHHFVVIPSNCRHRFSATEKGVALSDEFDRFKIFCKAVRLYKKASTQFVSSAWIIVPRALKLALRMKSFRFLIIGIKPSI